MIDALNVIRFSLRDFWEEFVWLILLNLLWSFAVLVPLIPVFVFPGLNLFAALGLILLLALPLPVISGALCFVTNQVSRGKAIGLGTFVDGLRRYWLKSLVVALVNIIVLALVVSNLRFYTYVVQGAWTNFALSAWLVVGIYWLLTQVFWFPMILELENEKVFLALRNALAMVIITPVFTITLVLIMAVLAALCIVLTLPAVVLMASLFLSIFNHATRSRIARVRRKSYRPGLEED